MERRYRLNRAAALLLAAVCLVSALLPGRSAYAAGIKLYNDNTKTTTNYTGAQVTYVYNGRTIRMQTPGIIISGIALADYQQLFAEALGLSCTYHKDTGKLTISDGAKTMVLTPGSKTAVVDGKSVSMSVAPVKLKFVDLGLEKLYVPTRFVSEQFGYGYVWSSSISTSRITKTLPLLIGEEKVDYNGTFYYAACGDKEMDFGHLPALSYHGVVLVNGQIFSEAAGCRFEQTETELTVTKGDVTVRMSLQDKSAYVNGKKFIIEEAPCLVTDRSTNRSYVMLPLEFTAKMLGFDLTYDDTAKRYTLLSTDCTGHASKIEAISNYQGISPDPSLSLTDLQPKETYFSWEMLNSYESVLERAAKQVHEMSCEDAADTASFLYPFTHYRPETDGREIFQFICTGKFSYVESSQTDGKLTVTLHHAASVDYRSTQTSFPVVSSYCIHSNGEAEEVTLEFSLNVPEARYSLEFSEGNSLFSVIVYPAYLTKLAEYSSELADLLFLEGITEGDVTLIEDDGKLVLQLSTVVNCLGDRFYYDIASPYLSYCLLNRLSGGTRITLLPAANTIYSMESVDNGIMLYFTEEENQLTLTWNEQKPPLPDDKLLIPLPDGITLNEVSSQDNYLNNNFVLSIKGNYTNFYKDHQICNPYTVIEAYSVAYNSTTGYTRLSFDTKMICAYEYGISDGYLIVNVARPSELYSKIVVLDAGHGGIDPGASYGGYKEKNLNFTVLNQYAKEYFEASGIKVYFTRLTDVKIDLYERADFAAEVGADLFISLHMNANGSTSVSGTQVFYSNSNNKKNAAGLNSYLLAKKLADALSTSMGTKNRGASSSEFVVVKYNTVPAVLIELGFMTNSAELKKLTNATYQKKAAETIYKTVAEIFKTYPTGR